MKINRLFGIIYYLLHRKSASAKEIAEHFEVSPRTILRDIDALSAAGIPIYAKQGKGGGIALMEGFVLSKTALTTEERTELILALQSVEASGYAGAAPILSRLSDMFEYDGHNWLEVDFSRWGPADDDKTKFGLLKNAIIKANVLEIHYAGSSGRVGKRKIYPLKLHFKGRAWYLQAYCTQKEDYRIFKLNRILNTVLGEEFFDRKSFDPPSLENEEAQIQNLITLEMEFERSAMHMVYDEFLPQNICQTPDGRLSVKITCPHDRWVYSFLLSMGSEVKVIGPTQVRENLLNEIEKIKNIYI